MAKAYYPSGGSFKEWTPDMVGAFPSQTIYMPSTAEARYYLLATVTAQQWGNYRCSFSINSRHSGCGMVTVAFGNNTDSLIHNNMYAQIYYYGTTNQVTDSQMFQVYGSADGKHYYLFAKSWDYNECKIRIFTSDFVLSRGDALTSIPTNTYGALLCNTTINPSNSVSWNDVSKKPSTYTPSSHTHSKSEVGLGNVDNTADSTKSVKYAASSNYANSAKKANGIVVSDTRNENPAPSSAAFDKQQLTADFKMNDKINSPTGFSGTYCGVLSLAPWSDASGGHGYQLAFGYASAGHPRLALRGSDLSANAWNSWYKIYTSDDKPTLSELGAAAARHSHDDRYYTESEMNTKLNAKAASDIVTISSTKPTSNTCKIWIKI